MNNYSRILHESIDVTRTPNFARWFGDSKVVDAAGLPLIVYHGGASGITVFDNSRFTDRKLAGIYFTSDRGKAKMYTSGRKSEGIVYPVYIRSVNPYVVKHQEDIDKITHLRWKNLIAKGYDSIVFHSQYRFLEIAVYSSDQIKSATDNSGEFDTRTPDIRK